jgi:hypothetical protein
MGDISLSLSRLSCLQAPVGDDDSTVARTDGSCSRGCVQCRPHLTVEGREGRLQAQPLRLCTYGVAVHASRRLGDGRWTSTATATAGRPKRAVGRGRVTKALADIGRNITPANSAAVGSGAWKQIVLQLFQEIF